MATKRKMVELTLDKKMELIERLDKGNEKYATLAKTFGIAMSTITGIKKNRAKVLESWRNCSAKRQRFGNLQYKELDTKTYQFFLQCRAENIPVLGPMLKDKAKAIAETLGIGNFSASNGWLNSFQRRHNVYFKMPNGKSADVVDDWKNKISQLIDGYSLADVFIASEICLLYHQILTSSGLPENDSCKEERLTVLLCCSAEGEKLTPLVIGNTAFRLENIDEKQLPVAWRCNREACMTADLFNEWLEDLNRRMKKQRRKILLLVDNVATGHTDRNCPNVVVKVLPLPLNKGIIQAVELNYRTIMLETLAARAKDCPSASGFAKSATTLDAIRWLATAWDDVALTTIVKCFGHAGFGSNVGAGEISNEENLSGDFSEELSDVVSSLVNMDQDLCELDEHEGSATDVLDCVLREESSGSDCDIDVDVAEVEACPSHQEAASLISRLVTYANQRNPELISTLIQLQEQVESALAAEKAADS